MSGLGVIVVAAGKGQRMMSERPKQFLKLAGKPILVHSIERFLEFEKDFEIVVVLNSEYMSEWEKIKNEYLPDIKVKIAIGGKERYHSVASGLEAITTSKYVAIHDAVRPCVGLKTIQNAFESAYTYGSGIPVVALKDSIRQLQGESSNVVDRNNFRIVQTPQTFEFQKIREAYSKPVDHSVTDDASVYQSCYGDIHLVQGGYQNIKITTPEDLLFAETLLNKKLPN